MSATKVERLLNLSAALLAAVRPLTQAEIRERVPGYAEDHESARRTFERDKSDLKEMGIPIEIVQVDHEGLWTEAYRIPRDQYALRDPGLDADELAALHFASRAVQLEGASSAEALATLAGERLAALDPPAGSDGDVVLARVPVDERLTKLFSGLVDHHPVTFGYNDVTRTVEPHRLDYQRGRWYLSGFDRQRGENRSFRVERIAGDVRVLQSERFVPPAQPHPGVVLRAWETGNGDPVTVQIAVDAEQASAARRHLGEAAETGTDASGRSLFEVVARNPDALRGLLLSFLDHAELLAPADQRAAVVAWLRAIVDAPLPTPAPPAAVAPATGPAGATGASGPAGATGASEPAGSTGGDSARRARVTAGERVRRMLSVVPWIVAHDGPTIDEICERFSLTRSQLQADLDVVFLVGLHPFTPDELIDVIIEDDRVFIRLADFFAQPLRLTPDQALALVAAGASLAPDGGADGDSPLARGLAKVAAVLGIDAATALEVRLGEARPDVLDLLRRAVQERRRVELDYYSYGRDTKSHRLVDPHRVYADGGQWYLDATCHQAGEGRLFRLDRVEAAVLTEEVFEPPAGRADEPLGQGVYHPAALDPRVVLDLEAAAAWLVEQYPCERVEPLGEGRLRVTLAISAVAWLERLLLRLGTDAVLVRADPPLGADIVRRAAGRVLARYEPAP